MRQPTLIVIGASAGGVPALLALTKSWREPLPVPILIVLHIGAQRSELPRLINSDCVMVAKHGEDGESLQPGVIYIAPPDRHMLVTDGHVRLTRGPKENWARPAIDPLFRSAAEADGPGVVGVILTGKLNDGTSGMFEVKRRGGVAIIQDPEDAAYPDMPRSAAAHVELDYCVPLAELPALLERLVFETREPELELPAQSISEKGRDMTSSETFDRPTTVTCPDCGGALRRTDQGALVKYDCHIGHSYTAEILAEAQFDDMEKIMRAAVRVLNERAEFCRQMADRGEDLGPPDDQSVWRRASRQALERAYDLRNLVEQDWIRPA